MQGVIVRIKGLCGIARKAYIYLYLTAQVLSMALLNAMAHAIIKKEAAAAASHGDHLTTTATMSRAAQLELPDQGFGSSWALDNQQKIPHHISMGDPPNKQSPGIRILGPGKNLPPGEKINTPSEKS